MSDYELLKAELEKLGDYVGFIGYLGGIRYEGWTIGKGEHPRSIIVGTDRKGSFGIYAFVGIDGAGVDRDIEFIRAQARLQQMFVEPN